YVLLLGSERKPAGGRTEDEEAGGVQDTGPLIKAGALAHGASVVPDDFKTLKVPTSIVCVENDPLFPEDVRKLGEDAMASANLEHEVQVYPGVPHGESTGPKRESAAVSPWQCSSKSRRGLTREI